VIFQTYKNTILRHVHSLGWLLLLWFYPLGCTKFVDVYTMMSTFINSKFIKWISNYVISMSITMFKTLGLHLCNQENIPTHWLISPNNCINNMNMIWMTSHAKCKGFYKCWDQ
jgi:hypothetical protein